MNRHMIYFVAKVCWLQFYFALCFCAAGREKFDAKRGDEAAIKESWNCC